MFFKYPVFALVSILFLQTVAFANEEWQFFRINAQYRGVIKQSYEDVGCALAWFKELSSDKTQMIAHVCALNPENTDEQYSFRVNIIVSLHEGSYSVDEIFYADFVGMHGERQTEIKQLMSLWKLIRDYCKNPVELNTAPDVWGKTLNLKTRTFSRHNRMEITAMWPGRRGFSGKFFLEPTAAAKWHLDKFRFSGGRVVVSMVQDSLEAIRKDFGQFSPFREVVFDN